MHLSNRRSVESLCGGSVCLGGVDESPVREDGKTEAPGIGGKNLEQIEEVVPDKRFTPGDRDVRPHPLVARMTSPIIQEIGILAQDHEKFLEREFVPGVGALVAVRTPQVAPLGHVPLQEQAGRDVPRFLKPTG